MKVSPVSADLLVKLALIAAAIGLAVYVVRRSTSAVSDAVGTVFDAAAGVADSIIVGVNPTNPDNWVNQGVTSIGGAIVSDTGPGKNADGSWTVGGWLYDVTHPGWADNAAGTVSGGTPVFNPATEETEGGGAVFGWFPQLGRQQSAATLIAQRGRVVGGL